MDLAIVKYPHPALRHESKNLRKVDAELKQIVARMFELMYEAKGVGLAANQVALPYRLFVANPTGDPQQKDQEYAFINPVISRPKGTDEAEEGCLSIPGLYADVIRPEKIHFNAYTLEGKEFNEELDGFFARVVQHESDHLAGVLFTDRLSPSAEMEVRPVLEEFATEFRQRREAGEIPDDETIQRQLAELERLRT